MRMLAVSDFSGHTHVYTQLESCWRKILTIMCELHTRGIVTWNLSAEFDWNPERFGVLVTSVALLSD